MSDSDFSDRFKVTFTPYRLGQAPPVPEVTATPVDFECDCGCTDIERGPARDLTYYHHVPQPAGVSAGYVVLRTGDDMDALVAAATLLYDGEGRWVGDIDHDSWRRVELKGES